MSLPRYRDYKDSGLSSLGEIPSHWTPSVLKRVVSLVESGVSVNAVDEPAGPNAPGVLKTSCVYTGSFDASENKAVVVEEFERVACPVKAGTLIVSRMNTPALVGAAGFVEEDAVNLFLPDRLWQVHFSGALPKFVYYWTASPSYRAQVQMACAGASASMQNLSQEEFLCFVLPLPPLDEQTAIATFLDSETIKLDTLIAEQERLIALLAEKLQATISHTVTRGLNPDTPMKDSGVDWLGEIPAHWSVKPLRYCVDYQEGPGILANDFHEEGIPLIRVSGVQSQWATLAGCNYLDPVKVAQKWPHFRLTKGDLLVSASASMGTICEVGDEAEGAIAYTGIIRLRGRTGEMLKDFARHMLVSAPFLTQIDLFKAGATIQHYGPTHLSQMFAVCPPEAEQFEIAAFIDQELERLIELGEEAERIVTLLRERRAALISAAVTGQIDVRGLADANFTA